MVVPISGGNAFDFGAAAQAATPPHETPATAVALVKPAAKLEPADTVKLSPGAHVRLLKTQGQTVAQIAVSTALSAETVNSYLGIAPVTPAVAAAKK